MPRYNKGDLSIRGDLGPHCSHGSCSWIVENLCDFPVSEGQTCDLKICDDHSHEVSPDVHYCEFHYNEWLEFKKSGGVKRVLENVIPYKKTK